MSYKFFYTTTVLPANTLLDPWATHTISTEARDIIDQYRADNSIISETHIIDAVDPLVRNSMIEFTTEEECNTLRELLDALADFRDPSYQFTFIKSETL
jgi:hypothetical protein